MTPDDISTHESDVNEIEKDLFLLNTYMLTTD